MPARRAQIAAKNRSDQSRSAAEPKKHRAGEIACDEILFEKFRWLRKRLADDRAVPPYIIIPDVTLRQMAR